MVKTQEEDKEMENLKHQHEVEILTIKEQYTKEEHKRKVERLNLLLDIAKAGGKVNEIWYGNLGVNIARKHFCPRC